MAQRPISIFVQATHSGIIDDNESYNCDRGFLDRPHARRVLPAGLFRPAYAGLFGCILETQPTGHVFGATELIHPGFETELCVRLGRGLEGEVTLEQVRAAVDVIHPSFEIIETRGDPVKQIPVALADNAQQRSVVVGAPVPLAPAMALDLVTARVQLNGQEVATGLGSAVLDHPLNSITWLAGKLGQYGRRLRPGDIIMTGSFVRQFPLGPGDVAVAEFSGIGRVEVRIAKV